MNAQKPTHDRKTRFHSKGKYHLPPCRTTNFHISHLFRSFDVYNSREASVGAGPNTEIVAKR